MGQLLLLLFWHASLGVHMAMVISHFSYRHQPPQRADLTQVDCFVQCDVAGSQILLNVFSRVIRDALVVSSRSLVGEPL